MSAGFYFSRNPEYEADSCATEETNFRKHVIFFPSFFYRFFKYGFLWDDSSEFICVLTWKRGSLIGQSCETWYFSTWIGLVLRKRCSRAPLRTHDRSNTFIARGGYGKWIRRGAHHGSRVVHGILRAPLACKAEPP